jgi:hypothetical protein
MGPGEQVISPHRFTGIVLRQPIKGLRTPGAGAMGGIIIKRGAVEKVMVERHAREP